MSEFGKIETIKKFLNFTYFVVRKKKVLSAVYSLDCRKDVIVISSVECRPSVFYLFVCLFFVFFWM